MGYFRESLVAKCSRTQWLSARALQPESQGPLISLACFLGQLIWSNTWPPICKVEPRHLLHKVWLGTKEMPYEKYLAQCLALTNQLKLAVNLIVCCNWTTLFITLWCTPPPPLTPLLFPLCQSHQHKAYLWLPPIPHCGEIENSNLTGSSISRGGCKQLGGLQNCLEAFGGLQTTSSA